MRKKTWIAGAATAMAIVAQGTAAHADTTGDQLKGGCSLIVVKASPVTGNTFNGFINEASVSLDGSNNPTTATVQCWVQVNGVEAPYTHLNTGGFGFEEGSLSTAYTATATDVVQLCQQVSFLDGSTWTAPDGSVGTYCRTI
ncbi:MAG: hypothetical protein QOC82_1312 [Frankiaceae bacterium]|jgi:hypothetical protein|nr:hypothetical protein [Frankiaceae bacterium]MDQ1698675.1 hypothetical protein [Frankiaceae bacterium]